MPEPDAGGEAMWTAEPPDEGPPSRSQATCRMSEVEGPSCFVQHAAGCTVPWEAGVSGKASTGIMSGPAVLWPSCKARWKKDSHLAAENAILDASGLKSGDDGEWSIPGPRMERLLRERLDGGLGDLDRKLDALSLQVAKCLEGISSIQHAADGWESRPSTLRTFSRQITPEQHGHRFPHVFQNLHLPGLPDRPGDKELSELEEETAVERGEDRMKTESTISGLSVDRSPPSLERNSPMNPARSMSFVSEASMKVFSRLQHRSHLAEKAWKLLEEPGSSPVARAYSIWWPIFICFGTFMSLVFSLAAPESWGTKTVFFDLFVDMLNTAEFLVRFWSCPNRIGFLRSPFCVSDFCAALPLVIRLAAGLITPREAEDQGNWFAWSFFMCIVPMFRLMKMMRHLNLFHVFVQVWRNVLDAMQFLLLVKLMLVLLFASSIYIFEPRWNVETLGDSMWFVIVSMSTVGYGDISPVTFEGHILASLLIFTSVFFMALPVGILGDAFSQVWKDRDYILLKSKVHDQVTVWGFDVKDIPEVFRMYDLDHDGELNVDEFAAMMPAMGVHLDQERAFLLFETLDIDGGGTVSEVEFVRSMFPTSFHIIYPKLTSNERPDIKRRKRRRGSWKASRCSPAELARLQALQGAPHRATNGENDPTSARSVCTAPEATDNASGG